MLSGSAVRCSAGVVLETRDALPKCCQMQSPHDKKE